MRCVKWLSDLYNQENKIILWCNGRKVQRTWVDTVIIDRHCNWSRSSTSVGRFERWTRLVHSKLVCRNIRTTVPRNGGSLGERGYLTSLLIYFVISSSWCGLEWEDGWYRRGLVINLLISLPLLLGRLCFLFAGFS